MRRSTETFGTISRILFMQDVSDPEVDSRERLSLWTQANVVDAGAPLHDERLNAVGQQ